MKTNTILKEVGKKGMVKITDEILKKMQEMGFAPLINEN